MKAVGQLKYVTVDSLKYIKSGQEVKLDFKTNDYKLNYSRIYPSLKGAHPIPESTIWVGDTVNLIIDDRRIEFIEYKGKTPDWYLFSAEHLESNNYTTGHILIIPGAKIIDIKGDSVLFRLTMELFENKRTQRGNPKDSWTIDKWIPKKMLEGVLIDMED